ncbi:hypothetical protein BDV10DRAFT_167233 [Aspergillus recurvatus]
MCFLSWPFMVPKARAICQVVSCHFGDILRSATCSSGCLLEFLIQSSQSSETFIDRAKSLCARCWAVGAKRQCSAAPQSATSGSPGILVLTGLISYRQCPIIHISESAHFPGRGKRLHVS